jgi:hypothetical protein
MSVKWGVWVGGWSMGGWVGVPSSIYIFPM